MRLLISIFLLSFASLASAADSKSLREWFLSYEVESSGAIRPSAERQWTLTTHLRSSVSGNPVGRDWLTAISKEKLGRLGINAKSDNSDLTTDFKIWAVRGEGSAAGLAQVTKPRLIIEISVDSVPGSSLVEVKGEISAVVYTQERGNLLASLVSSRDFRLPSLSLAEVKERLASQLRRELDFLHSKRPGIGSSFHALPESRVFYTYNRPAALYPEIDRPNSILLGATVGTPASANLFAGVWGVSGFPLTASISGMYFGRENRGLQIEAGYLLNPRGTVQHSLGLALVGFNDTKKESREILDPNGGVVSTEIVTIDRIRFYAGPSWQAHWRFFHVEAGVGLPLSADSNSKVRAFFQLGLAPKISF